MKTKALPIPKKITKKTRDITTGKGEIAKNDNLLGALHGEVLLHNIRSVEWRKRLCFTMHKYFAEDVTQIVFNDFCHAYGIPVQTYYNWIHDYPDDVGKVHKEVMQIIASRRQGQAMRFQLADGPSYRDMHRYDMHWAKEVDTYKAQLKSIETAVATGIELVALEAIKRTKALNDHEATKGTV
jgi:hypothetical protein